jgi:diguanylate cyclase (GGDEF)-like protein
LVRDAVPYVVACGDLDHFKQLNDTFGHDVGDRALRLFATVLRDSIRPNDLACRYGGEEFVVVIPDCSVDEAVSVVERVRTSLADGLSTGRLPSFTVSFGVASSRNAESFERVVSIADSALLQAKASGRDRVTVADGMPALLPGPVAISAPEDG